MRQILITVAACLLLSPVAGQRGSAAAKERVYKGKSVSAWIAPLKARDSRANKNSVILTLGEIGPDAKAAVPLLIEALKDENLHYEAVVALGDIGPEAKAAVPALLAGFRKKGLHRYEIARTLGLIGTEAVPALMETLENEEPSHEWAIQALEQVGEPAVEPLIRALHSKKHSVRSAGADVLARIGPRAKAARKPLLELTKDERSLVRVSAAWALFKITAEAKEAVPSLLPPCEILMVKSEWSPSGH